MRQITFFIGSLLCLSLLGCAGRRDVATWEERARAVARDERLEAATLLSPGGMATLRVPLSGGRLPDLPGGATFARRDGVASVSARVARDTLYIVATCDSLQRLVWAYERRLAGEASESATTERHADWRPVRLWPYLLAIVALFVLVYVLKRPERHISQQ